MPEDIYDTDKRLKKMLEKIKALHFANSKLILDFHEKYSIKNKLRPIRQMKLLIILSSIAKILEKPLNKLSEKDIERINAHIWTKERPTTIQDFAIEFRNTRAKLLGMGSIFLQVI